MEEHELRKSQDHAENEAAVDDQKALQKSEEMMKAFLTATGGEEEESNKSERTRTIIKTIKVLRIYDLLQFLHHEWKFLEWCKENQDICVYKEIQKSDA